MRYTNMEPAVNYHSLSDIVSSDLALVEDRLKSLVSSEVQLVSGIGSYVISSGGKRIRPVIMLLAARAITGAPASEKIIDAAASVECLHTATLIHDDVVDGSSMRRGRHTANYTYGIAPTVLIGDYLLARAVAAISGLGNGGLYIKLAETVSVMAEGEIQQLDQSFDTAIKEETYRSIIYAKTARLFETSAWLAASLSTDDEKTAGAFSEYGRHIGNAFQITDDVIDYISTESAMGKNPGDDFMEGKITLPVIAALRKADSKDAGRLRDMFHAESREGMFEEALSILKKYSAIAESADAAMKEAELAACSIRDLSLSATEKNALLSLCSMVCERIS